MKKELHVRMYPVDDAVQWLCGYMTATMERKALDGFKFGETKDKLGWLRSVTGFEFIQLYTDSESCQTTGPGAFDYLSGAKQCLELMFKVPEEFIEIEYDEECVGYPGNDPLFKDLLANAKDGANDEDSDILAYSVSADEKLIEITRRT